MNITVPLKIEIDEKDIEKAIDKYVRENPDVVEVVRCKDCECCCEVQGYEDKGRKVMCCFTHGGLRFETDYCSYGERREDTE